MVHHYTDIDAMRGILGTKMSTPKVVFRASDVTSCEGQQELNFTYEDIVDIIIEVENERKIDAKNQISRLCLHSLISGLDASKVLNISKDDSFTPYIICFSNNPHNKYFWDDLKKDICIHFDEKQLYSTCIPDGVMWGMDVMYEIDRKRIKNIINEWYNVYFSYLVASDVLNDIYKYTYKLMWAMRYEIYPFLKRDSFKREEEYRVLCVSIDETLEKRNVNKKYIEIEVPVKSLKGVSFSSRLNTKEIQNIHNELVACGYNVRQEDGNILFV